MGAQARQKARATRGYILLEAVAALAVLSIGTVAVHQAMREAIATRAQARDYTQARFLLDTLMGEIALQPVLVEGRKSGAFDDARFTWACVVSRANLPDPPPLVDPQGVAIPVDLPVRYLTRIEAAVRWTRRGQTFDLTAQTLFGPERLYVPPDAPAIR